MASPISLNSSTSFNPEPAVQAPTVEPAAEDPHEAIFTSFARFYYALNRDATKIHSAFSLIQLIHDHVTNSVGICLEKDPDFIEKLMEVKKAGQTEFMDEFFLRLGEFRKTKDPTQVRNLLMKMMKALVPFIQVNKYLELFLNYYIRMDQLFETRRLDLFDRSALSLCPELHLTPAEHYRVAVKACQYLNRSIVAYRGVIVKHLEAQLDCIAERNMTDHLSEVNLLNHPILQRNTTLTKPQKCDIIIAFRGLSQEYLMAVRPLMYGFDRCLSETVDSYFDLLHSPEVDQICLSTGVDLTKEQTQIYNRKYVQEHLDVFENFIPRVAELRDWIALSTGKLEKNCMLLRFFPFYLQLGDMKALKERLEKNHESGGAKAILFDEIEKFANRYKTDHALQLQILPIVRESKTLADHTKSFLTQQAIFYRIHSHTHTLLDCPLKSAEHYSPHLFYVEPEAPKPAAGQSRRTSPQFMAATPVIQEPKVIAVAPVAPAVQELTPVQVIQVIAGAPVTPAVPEMTPVQVAQAEANAGAPVTPAVPEPTPVVQVRPARKVVPYAEWLQHLRTQMGACVDQLKSKSPGFGTKEALENVQVHWESLLCTMKRALDQKGEIAEPELAAFIIDIVRQSSLMMEETLTAMDRSSNNLKDQKALTEHITHDLVQILQQCKFKSPLPSQFRSWIQEMNSGEILSRNLRECSIDGTYVEKLLTKARLLSAGKNVFSRENIMSHALEYFQRAGLLCLELQGRIPVPKARGSAPLSTLIGPLRPEFQEFCAEVKQELTEARPLSVRPAYDLSAITNPIEEFKGITQSREVQGSLKNLQSNLCLQLQVEMKAHEFLEPIDCYRHMSKVILLNQMIAEEYLLNLCDALGVNYKLQEMDHDLAGLAVSLGMSQKDFSDEEWNFLSEGKGIRFLARYPASYAVVRGGRAPRLERAIQNGIKFSRNELFQQGNDAEKGFAPVGKKLSGELNTIKHMVMKDFQTLSSILYKISGRKMPQLEALNTSPHG